MEEKKVNGRAPDFRVDGVAVWVNETKNKEKYLTVKMVGHTAVNVFKNNPKPKVTEENRSFI